MSAVTILKPRRVIDAESNAALDGHVVHVVDDRIDYVGPEAGGPVRPPDTVVIDLPDHTVLPGFIDAHAHVTGVMGVPPSYLTQRPALEAGPFQAPGPFASRSMDTARVLTGLESLKTMLYAGVTVVRDLGGPGSAAFDLRAAVNTGFLPGPRMLVAGRIICPTGGHGYVEGQEADGPDGMRLAARLLFKEGADLLKVTASGGGATAGTPMGRPTMTVDELRAVASEATQRGSYATAHCHSIEGIERCLEAGVSMIEHAIFLATDGVVRFDPALADRLATAGVVVSPTMAVFGRWVDAGGPPGLDGNPGQLRAWKVSEATFWRRMELLGQLHDAGVRLIVGSDAPYCGVPFDDFGHGIALHARAGVGSIDAIKQATSGAADALGLGGVTGRLRVGLDADIIAVRGNPLERIEDISAVEFVMQRGSVVRGLDGGEEARFASTRSDVWSTS